MRVLREVATHGKIAAAATMFQKLAVVLIVPENIGLNGRSRFQDASTHTDCARDASDQLSLLIYIGENTDGDLLLFEGTYRCRRRLSGTSLPEGGDDHV